MTGHGCTFLAGFTAVYGSTVWGGWQISRGAESCENENRFIREVTRRGAKNTFVIHEGPRRNTKNIFFDPRRHAMGVRRTPLLSTKGHQGTRRTPFLIREGARRTAGDTESFDAATRVWRTREHPQGVPLRDDGWCIHRVAGLGTHKGCPYGGVVGVDEN